MSQDPLESVDPRALGARLKEAREARGLTQHQVAEKLGVARTTVVAIEKGERRIRPSELVALAALVGRALSDLLQSGSPSEGFSVQLRGGFAADAQGKPELSAVIAEFEALARDYVHLERLCQAPLRRRYPAQYEIESIDPELAAEDVARAERSRLGLGDVPLLNLRDLLESDVGLRIFQLELPSDVAGMFAFTDELGGCVAINIRHPAERRRHSLAHEYGHFLSSRFRSEILYIDRYERLPHHERFAEAFARAFLLPEEGLRRRFLDIQRERGGKATYGDLCRLANFYGVSLEAMTRRLEELQLIPTGVWERLKREGFRVREAQRLLGLEPPVFGKEPLPSRFIALAVEAWQRAELSEGQLARILRTDRLGARARVEQLQSDGDDQLDLSAPVMAAGSGRGR